VALLVESGLWTALRTRPFSRVPSPESAPEALFVTAIDTQPLAPDIDAVVRGQEAAFRRGLDALRMLVDGPIFCCRPIGSTLGDGVQGITTASFGGKHPAGNVGYHIHTLYPVSRGRSVWHIGAQDVIRIGQLVNTGEYDASQIVSIGGPGVTTPRLLRTELGAHIPTLINGNTADGHQRVISGSVLTGTAVHDAETAFLGRFHQQITVLPEGGRRTFLGWLRPSTTAFSALPVYRRLKQPRLDTQLNGSPRAMVPIGAYERVMPFDMMPTHLLRALSVGDTEWAESLGVLELDEEDIALCSVVCPGKYEYGDALRRVLDQLATEV
jgi:Na+-transporting NADH:ubiquinone oxidoreductase subunit A